MAVERASPKVAVDDIVEAAAHGVLRALEARKLGVASVADLVRSGFAVDFIIRAGGITPALMSSLNPQPLPPRD
jgi:hypothetical protein